MAQLIRIPTLKTTDDFRRHVAALGINLPCDDSIESGSHSPLAKHVEHVRFNGRHIGNRIAIQPMEGWDGTTTGGITQEVLRRWQRFGESGAKLIYGGEAMAGRRGGCAEAKSLNLKEQNKARVGKLWGALAAAQRGRSGM